MKTAMEKKETGLMRQIGYLSFVVVLLYGLTLFAVSCDNDEDPPLPPAVEKVVLAFGVDQGEGQLSAKPELENTAAEKIGELISPAEIAKAQRCIFVLPIPNHGQSCIGKSMASLFVLWSRSRLSSSMSIRRFGLLSSLTSHRNRRGCKTNCVSKAIKY